MEKQVTAIDAKKFLQYLGLEDSENLTSEDITQKLSTLTREELQDLAQFCAVETQTIEERVSVIDVCNKKPILYPESEICSDKPEFFLPLSTLKHMLKYERNPMRRKEIQSYIADYNYNNGKHKRGSKRKKK